MPIQLSRLRLIKNIRHRLERDGLPRLQMSFLVLITAAAGFISSYTLLQLGMSEMWLRYLVAVAIAYLVFLLLLWLWLRTCAEDYLDLTNVADVMPFPHAGDDTAEEFAGEGGNFGGGGASATYESRLVSEPLDSSSVSADKGVVEEAINAVSGADELAIPLLVLVLFVALLLSSLFVVYSAPVLFAELLLDGVLAAGLYRRLRKLEHRHWLETALRRTFWPFMLTALLVTAAGWGMELYAPGAHSIGDVLFQLRTAE